MNRTTLATSYRILTKGRNLLAHLLCLLLIVSTPVLAQGTPDVTHPQSLHVDGVNAEFEDVTGTFCADGTQYGVKFTANGQVDPFFDKLDPDLQMKLYSQGAGKPSDQRNTYDMGVDPATLNPEALDLNIFPTFEISAQLSLIPSLSYSPNHVLGRMGRLQYGPPKQWYNHYGELVVLLSPTKSQKIPVGDPLPGANAFSDTERRPAPVELQVFFINASGQQVNFYPDPARMGTDNKPLPPPGNQVKYWYSEDGTYKLEDLKADPATGAFDFKLTTSSGLVMTFEPYAYHLDMEKEALTRHFRVDRIQDRYANFVDILYRDEQTTPPGPKTLQPWKAKGFANHSDPEQAVMLQEIEYKYDSRNRLEELVLPAVGQGQTQSYKFYYLDSKVAKTLPLGDGTTTNRLKLNNIYPQTLQTGTSGTYGSVRVSPLVNVQGVLANIHNSSTGLFLNVSNLGFTPEIGVDFQEVFTSGGYTGEFKSAPHLFHVDTQSNSQLLKPSGKARQIASRLAVENDPLRYRYKLDSGHYASAGVNSSIYPDYIETGSTTLALGNVDIAVLPRLKHGDLIAWIGSGNTIQSRMLDLQPESLIHWQNGTYEVPLQSGSATPPSTGLHFIRKDQRDRIAEIEYPGVAGSSKKRLLFKYAEYSRNHAVIEEILTFDEDVNTGEAQLMSQTTYTYEHVLVQTAAEDLATLSPGALDEFFWRNCVRVGRELFEPEEHGVKHGVNRLRRHEVIDMLRHKRVRYYQPGQTSNPGDNYRELETFYGGSWRIALLADSLGNEDNPTAVNDPDLNKTCDVVEWGIAQKPFLFTWQINPDGSAQIYDLSADGVGLDETLAYANSGVRVFKTYQFDTRFKQALEESVYSHFLGSSTQPYTPYYEYFPNYALPATPGCAPCTIPDLEAMAAWPANREIPAMGDVFGLSDPENTTPTIAYGASIDFFEPIPLYGYSLLTDVDPEEPLKRVALGTIHGSFQGDTHNPSRTFYRASALEGIEKILNTQPTQTEAMIDKLLRGQMISRITTVNSIPPVPNFLYVTYDVPWAYGGSFPSSSCFQYIHQRQKNHRLRPHAQIQLQKLARIPGTHALEGLKWDGTKNLLDLDQVNGISPWVVEASRYSNGGYLGKGSATGWTTTGNESTLTGVNAPSEAQAGDFVYHQNKMYQLVENVSGSSVKVKPALDGDSQGLSNLQFYRYYSPNASPTYPYMGYDVFGNNAFKATYKRTELKFSYPQNKAAGDDHGLVPDFFDSSAIPFTLSLNDSTADANNDDADWTFFGRVTRQFNTGKLPLDYDNNGTTLANTTDWRMGMVTDWAYPTTTGSYKWLPTEKAAYFLPKTLGTVDIQDLNLSLLQGLTLSADAEDVRTSYRYYAKSSSPNITFASTNPMAHGRLSLEWTGKSDSPGNPDTTHFTATRYDYDTEGWLAVRDTASFKVNGASVTSDYGIRTTQTHDKATGLVIDEKSFVFHDPVWNSGGQSAESRLVFSEPGAQRSHTKNEYDRLGRNTKVENFLPNGTTRFGNVTKTMYTSQTQTSVQTLDHGNQELSTQWTFLNGQGQPVSSLRQRGGETSRIFATYTAYDAFGRPDVTGSEREVTLTGQQTALDHAVGNASAGGYSKTRYNLRGEAFGTEIYEAGIGVVQSSWIVKTQDAAGNLSTLNVKQVPDTNANGSTNPAFLNIKALHLNANGLLERVEDHQVANTENLWADVSEVNILSDVGTLSATTTLKAKAVYTFDRMAKVTKAEVGTSATQIRTFTFDQRGRLRKETHPEMPNISVNYSNFDGLDNVGTVEHLNASQTALRTWNSTYDAAGNLLQHQAGAMVTDYVYNYAATFAASNPAAYPEYPRSIRHRDTNALTGSVFLYRNSYDPTNGLLLKRSLFHDRAGFPGESSEDLTIYDLADSTDPDVSGEGLDLTYSYDALGRVQQMTYPTALQGVQEPTKLEFIYDLNSGLLTRVDDLAFSPKLTVLDNLQYGVGDQLTYTDFAKPIASHKNNLSRTYDSLNRLEKWKVVWNGGSNAYAQDREYGYDSGGRIHQIRIDPPAGGGGTFKGFRYAYDALSQLKQARFDKPGTTPATTTWDYGYDDLGFGNLTSFKANGDNQIPENAMNLANNQISSTDATYSALGEMEHYTDNGLSYDLNYNDLGRVKTLTSSPAGNLTSIYHYDHAGMRLFTEVKGSQADAEVQTLYFYDVDGMVLCEWVAPKLTETWGPARWDRSYVYLAGKSSMTYEYDQAEPPAQGGSMPEGPAMVLPLIIHTPTLAWQDVGPGAYDLEIQTDEGKPVAKFIGINGTQWTYPQLKYGKFQIRARQSEMVWGPWHSVYYMDAVSAEAVVQVSLNGECRDQSFYRNHPEPQGDVHYVAGKEIQGLYLGAGETLLLNQPHANLITTHGSTSFWVKPTLDTASEELGPNRTFWSLGSIKLTVNNHGAMRVKYPGSSPFQPSIILDGNAWQHVAAVYGSGTLKVYLNNVQVFDLSGVPTSAITTSDMTWGNSSTTTGAAVGIDDIRCFNKALTANDVSDEFYRWN